MSEAIRPAESKDPYNQAMTSVLICSRRHLACAFLLGLFLISSIEAQSVQKFPGRESKLISPNHRYAIENVERAGEPRHVLLMTDKSSGKTREVYQYARRASVLWSPDSRTFAIDDAAGSDYTETKIFSVKDGAVVLDVQKKIGKLEIPHGHHEYFYIASWIGPSSVLVYHWGYGEEQSNLFCECYVYKLNGPVRRCPRQPKNSDSVCEKTEP